MALCSTFCNFNIHIIKHKNGSCCPRFQLSQKFDDKIPIDQIKRRELMPRSGELATIGAIFNFSGKKPDYLGVQKNPPALALCPATNNCISTSENVTDLTHYAPPWNYNPEGGKDRVNREEAMEELIDVLVDDVEFWFPPDQDSIVEYRSASRFGNFDFDVNRKRIKALRLELEKRGWASQDLKHN